MSARRRMRFARARRPVAVAMRAIAQALPVDGARTGRRSVFSARAKQLLALWRTDEGTH